PLTSQFSHRLGTTLPSKLERTIAGGCNPFGSRFADHDARPLPAGGFWIFVGGLLTPTILTNSERWHADVFPQRRPLSNCEWPQVFSANIAGWRIVLLNGMAHTDLCTTSCHRDA